MYLIKAIKAEEIAPMSVSYLTNWQGLQLDLLRGLIFLIWATVAINFLRLCLDGYKLYIQPK